MCKPLNSHFNFSFYSTDSNNLVFIEKCLILLIETYFELNGLKKLIRF